MIAAALLVAGCVIVGLVWLRSEHARCQVESLASRRLGREVRIESVNVGWNSVSVVGLTVADPWSDEPALMVDRGVFEVDWMQFVEGGLGGTLRASSFELLVRKRGAETNFHGMGGERRTSERALDLAFALHGGRVELHEDGEVLQLDGVAVDGGFRRREAIAALDLEVEVERATARGASVHDVTASLRVDGDRVELTHFMVELGAGHIEGHAEVRLAENTPWSASVKLRDAAIETELFPLVVAVFPAAVGMRTRPRGALSARADVRAKGFSHAQIVETLEGRLLVELADFEVPGDAVLARVAERFDRSSSAGLLRELDIEASVRGPWVRVDSLRVDGREVSRPFDGRVALDGRLDLELDAVALLRMFPDFGVAQGHEASVVVGLRGTTREPEFVWPSPQSVARAAIILWRDRAHPRAP